MKDWPCFTGRAVNKFVHRGLGEARGQVYVSVRTLQALWLNLDMLIFVAFYTAESETSMSQWHVGLFSFNNVFKSSPTNHQSSPQIRDFHHLSVGG
jgi:hypothetical protein